MSLREAKNNMATPAVNTTDDAPYPGMAVSFFEPLWYAVYTNVNQEKQVAQQLGQRSIEHLLPLYDTVRRWKDRRVRLQMPLFPGYVFVRFALRDRLQVLQIPRVVHLVSFGGHPAPLREEDIHAIQNCLSHSNQVEPHPYLQAGRRARVRSGPLQGLEGIILRRKNRTRFILSFDLIMRSVAVEIDDIDLVPAG
jgi:transcription antitermination factor NusG